MKKSCVVLLGLLWLAPWVWAQDEEDAEDANQVRYLEITPAFVTNYGGPGKMRYIKTEISVQVDSAEDMRNITYHVATLRHAMVMLLSKQTLDSVDNQEQIRKEALQAVRDAMQQEIGDPTVDDLLFTSFYMQN